jgi:TonB family protein
MANGILKSTDGFRGALLASAALFFMPHSVSALQPAIIGPASGLYFQQSGVGAPLGKLHVPMKAMSGSCTTMVSPSFPRTADQVPKASTVLVHVVIWKSGSVTPVRVVSGDPALETEAMNAVRLWRYKPYFRDGEALDVSTDIQVDFDPAKPGGIVTHPNQ